MDPGIQQQPKDYLTSGDVAALLGISLRTVVNLRRRRVLPYIRLGRVVRFRRSQVEQALEAHTVNQVQTKSVLVTR